MKRLRVFLGTGMVVATCALAPSAALAYSSGTFTKAVATEDWTHGSFAATVNAAPCGAGACSYSAVVFAQPNLPAYNCKSEEFFDNDRNTEQLYGITGGDKKTANASFEVSASNIPILRGVYGQRYCLELIGEREVPDVLCETQRKVIEEFDEEYGGPGGPHSPCPPRKVIFGEYVAGSLMTAEVPPPAPAPVASTPSPSSAASTAPSASCAQARAAVTRGWQRVTKAREALQLAKRKHQPTKIKRQAWARDKKEAQQTEEQQRALCG
jgi:hypothetical protein